MSRPTVDPLNAAAAPKRFSRLKLATVLLILIPLGLLVALEVPTLIAEQATEAKRREIAKAGGKCTLERRPPAWLQALAGSDFHSILDRTVIVGVSMTGPSIDDYHVRTLAGLPEVEFLEFEDAQVSALSLKTIGELKSLKSVNLSSTPIGDITDITRLPRLQQLNVSYTKLRDSQLSSLARLKNLRRVNAAGLQLTDAGVAHLAQCAALEELNISGAALGPNGLEPLQSLTELKSLVLRSCQLDPDDLRRLAAALPNCKFAT